MSPSSDWQREENGHYTRAVPPTPRTLSRIQLNPFAAPHEVAPLEKWTSPEAQQQALSTYSRMQAVESAFGGRTPGQAVLGIPEYNQGLREGKIDPKSVAQAEKLLEEGRSGGNRDKASIRTQVLNLASSNEGEPEQWHLIPEKMPQKSQYQEKLEASQDTISRWYDQTTRNASRVAGREVKAEEIRRFIPNLSHEQLEAITSRAQVTSTLAGPGAGKSTQMVAQFMDDVFNRGGNPNTYQFLSKTHSAVNNMKEMLSGVEQLIPNWKPQEHQFRTLDSAGLSLLTRRDENGTSALQRMGLSKFTPLYQGGAGKNLEDLEKAQQNATGQYLKKVMSQYGISTKSNNPNDLESYIALSKSQRMAGQPGIYEEQFSRGADVFKGGEWKGDAALKQQVSPDLVLFLYEQSLKHQPGFRMPSQQAGKFDINDVAYLVQKGAQQGHIAPMQRFMGDEIQDASPSQVAMLANLTGPQSRGFLAGDMGQMAVQRRWRIDEEIGRQFGGASQHTLTGNYRSGPYTVGQLNSINQLGIMQGVPKSPFQVAMGRMDQAPTVSMQQDFPALYRQMIQDWMRLQGTSVETIKEKMAAGEHPLQGLQYPAQRTPFAFQISRQGKGRPVFRDVVREMLGEQFMSQYYSEETPRSENMDKLHAMTISQLRSRDVDHLFGDVTRGGKWDAVGYAQNLYTMLSRAKEQNHLYASATNYPGSQYDLTPARFGGQQVPPGFDALIAGMAQNATGTQGLSELPTWLQEALSSFAGNQSGETSHVDLGLTQKALEEMLFLNEHYQPQVGDDTGVTDGKMDMARTEDGRLLQTTSKMSAANIAGQYKRGGDPIRLQQALKSIRTLVSQGNMGDQQPVPNIQQFMAQMKSLAGPVDVKYEDVDFAGLRMAFDPTTMAQASGEIPEHDNEQKEFAPRDSHYYEGRDMKELRNSMKAMLEKPEAMAHPVVQSMLAEQWTDPRMVKAITGISKSLASTGKRPDMERLNKYMMLGQKPAQEIEQEYQKLFQRTIPLDEKTEKPLFEELQYQQREGAKLSGKQVDLLREFTGRTQPLSPEEQARMKTLKMQRNHTGEHGLGQVMQAIADPSHSLNHVKGQPSFQSEWLRGVVEDKSRELFSKSWIDPVLMEKLATVAEEVADQIGDRNPTHRQYFLDKASKFRTYKSFDLDRENGASINRQDIERIRKQNPFQGALLDRMFGDQVKQHGVVKLEKAGKEISQMLYHQGGVLRKINTPEQGQLLGVPYHISSLAPALTELRTYASSLEGGLEGNRGGIVDPMAVAALPLHLEAHENSLDKDFSFQQYGAGVGLANYEKRLQEMLHPKSGVMQEAHQQDLQRQLGDVQHIRETIHDPQWQLRTAQLMRVVTRATTGQDVMNKNQEADEYGNLGMDPIRDMFANRKNDYREGMRTLESLKQFISVLSEASDHVERTGSIKRSQIASILSTFGHSYDDKQFTGLRMLESSDEKRMGGKKPFLPTYDQPDPSLSLRGIIDEYPHDQETLHGQLTRVPLLPGVKYRFMGGQKGFANLSEKQGEQGVLKAGMEGTLAQLGNGDFGLSKKIAAHRSLGVIPMNEYGATTRIPGKAPYTPIMQFQTGEGKSFPVLSDQLMMVPGQDLSGILPWQQKATPDVQGSVSVKEEEPAKKNELAPLSFPEQVQQRLLREAAHTREQGFVMGYTSHDAKEMSRVPFKKVLPLLTRPGGVKGIPTVTQKGEEQMARGEFFSKEQAEAIRQEQIERGQIIPPTFHAPSPEVSHAAKAHRENLEALGHSWNSWLRGGGLQNTKAAREAQRRAISPTPTEMPEPPSRALVPIEEPAITPPIEPAITPTPGVEPSAKPVMPSLSGAGMDAIMGLSAMGPTMMAFGGMPPLPSSLAGGPSVGATPVVEQAMSPAPSLEQQHRESFDTLLPPSEVMDELMRDAPPSSHEEGGLSPFLMPSQIEKIPQPEMFQYAPPPLPSRQQLAQIMHGRVMGIQDLSTPPPSPSTTPSEVMEGTFREEREPLLLPSPKGLTSPITSNFDTLLPSSEMMDQMMKDAPPTSPGKNFSPFDLPEHLFPTPQKPAPSESGTGSQSIPPPYTDAEIPPHEEYEPEPIEGDILSFLNPDAASPPTTEKQIRAVMKQQRLRATPKQMLPFLPHLSPSPMKLVGVARGTGIDRQVTQRIKFQSIPTPIPLKGAHPSPFIQAQNARRKQPWYPFQRQMSQAQKGVFDDKSQHILIQGGPGSGKSSTFVNKLAEMIHRQGVRPDKIVTISPMHSGEEALNKQYNERLRPTIPQRPGVGGLRNAQTMHAMAHDIIFGGREEDEQTGQMHFPNLEKMGMGHIQGILADVNEEELARMSPESRGIKLRAGTVPFLKEALSQHPTLDKIPGQKRLGELLTGIGNLKKGRMLAGSSYQDAMREGMQHISEGKVTQEAALAAYQHHMGKEGLIDFDDYPVIAAQMLQQQGANALPSHLQGLQVLGVDEAQDTTPAAMNFFEQVLKTTGGDPRMIVGMDPMQGLLEDLGSIPSGDVVPAYKDLFGRLGGSSTHHELNTNFRSDKAAIELNNAILQVATNKGEKGLSSPQVPGPHAQYGKREKITLSNSDVSLNQRMFRSMLSKTGVDQKTIAANLQSGHSPFAGVDWSQAGVTKPSQIPGIFLTKGRRDFFQHIAGQTLQDDYNLSPPQASAAVKAMLRHGVPGQKVLQSDAKRQAAETQFPIGTVAQFRGLQFEQPHVDVTRAGAWMREDKIGSYLKNLRVGTSRVSEGGQNQLFASDRPFMAFQQKMYQRGVPFDESTPNQPGQGIVQLGTGRGSLITPSEATAFGKVGKQLVPNSVFEDILPLRNAMTQPAPPTGSYAPAPTVPSLSPPPPPSTAPPTGGLNLTLPPGGNVSIQGTNPQISVPNATITPSATSAAIPPPPPSPTTTTGATRPLSFAGAPPAMIASLPTQPLPAVPAMIASLPTQPLPAVPAHITPSPQGGIPIASGNGGGDASPPSTTKKKEPSTNSYFDNISTTMGRTMARIGYEMQFVGKLFDSITTQAAAQGSEYRRGSMGLTGMGSGPTGDAGFFDFTSGKSGISQMSTQLPMYSKSQLSNLLKTQSSLTGKTTEEQQATTSILGLSALSGMDATSLMKDIGQTTGTLGQGGNQQATQQLVGMLGNLYNGNLTELNVAPTLSAINQVLPTLQGATLGGGSQLPGLMGIFKAALGSGMTSQNMGQVAQTVGSLAQIGTTPDLAGQQFLSTLFPGQMTADTQLADYQKQQVEMGGQIQQMQLQQQQLPQQMAINNAEMSIQQASLGLSQQELGIQQQGLSLDKAELTIQQANLTIDKAALQLQGQDLALNQQSLGLSRESLGLSQAQFEHSQQMQDIQYGPIGADVSREAYFSFMRNQQAAGYNPLSAETGTQFKSAPTAGLENMQFYAGIEHQRQTAVLGRSPLMSDALFQENQKYLNEQEAFYEQENKLRNEDRAFQRDSQQKNLAIQGKQLDIQQSHLDISKQQLALSGQRLDLSQQSLDISKARLDLSKQSLDIQQKRLGLEEQRLTLDEQRNAMQNEQLQLQLKLLPEQITAIQNLQTAMQQYAEGQGPVNGQNVQPTDIIKQLSLIGDDAQLKQTIQMSRLPADQQGTLYQLIKQVQKEGGFDNVQASTTKDDKALMDKLNKLVQGGAFTDQSANAAIQDALLNFGGKGDIWKGFMAAFNDANKNWKNIASFLSRIAPATEKMATFMETWGPVLVGLSTLFNSVGFGQGMVSWLKGGGAAKIGGGVTNVAGKVGGGVSSFFGAGGGAGAILGSSVGSVAAPLALGAAALFGGWQTYNKDMYSNKTPLANRLGYGVLTSLLPGISTGEQLHHDWDLFTDPKMRKSSGIQGAMDWAGGLWHGLFGGGGKPAVGAAGSADFSTKPKYGMYMAEINPQSMKQQQDSIKKQETWWQSMITTVQKDWGDFTGKAGQVWNTTWTNTINGVDKHFSTVISNEEKAWGETIGKVGEWWNIGVDGVEKHFSTVIENEKAAFLDMLGSTGASWNILVGNVGGWWNSTIGDIGQWWNDTGTNVGTAFSNAAGGIGDAFQSWIIDPLYKFFTQTLPDTIQSALSNLSLPNLFGGGGGSADFNNTGGAPGGFTTPHVNAQFGEQMNYGKHQGVDFNAAQGTPLHEFIGGAVTNTGFHDWGGEVDVNIGGGLTERYLHLSQISVHPGQKVGQGGFLGLTGGGTPASGLGYWSAGAHSHVQVDRGDINAGINPWPVWAAGGATNISGFYGGGTGGGGRGGAGGPVPRSLISGNARPSSLQVSSGGGGSTIAATSAALRNLPLSANGGGSTTSQVSQPTNRSANVVIQNLIGQAHFAITTGTGGTLSEAEQDKLMSQLLDILTDATKQLLGKL